MRINNELPGLSLQAFCSGMNHQRIMWQTALLNIRVEDTLVKFYIFLNEMYNLMRKAEMNAMKGDDDER